VKIFDITTTASGHRVEVSDEIAEKLQEMLAKPGVHWIAIPGARPGVELTWINLDHIVSIEIEIERRGR
jgi:hypothetical protein